MVLAISISAGIVTVMVSIFSFSSFSSSSPPYYSRFAHYHPLHFILELLNVNGGKNESKNVCLGLGKLHKNTNFNP